MTKLLLLLLLLLPFLLATSVTVARPTDVEVDIAIPHPDAIATAIQEASAALADVAAPADDDYYEEQPLVAQREFGTTTPLLLRSLLRNLTLHEKIALLHGSVRTEGYTGLVPGVPRLRIPSLRMNDGPQGFRGPPKTSTAWPCGLALAATFDPSLVRLQAEAMGREFVLKGANVFLGPGVNLARIPQNGRNFEYLAGEDARLGELMVSAFVTGLQSNRGLMTTVKHYVNNDQETNRNSVNVVVDRATEMNLYYRPFRAAVKAGSWGVMCSYNKINGSPGCSNRHTLRKDLKSSMRFKGFVVSDWFATRDTFKSARNGLDIEMPVPVYFGEPLRFAAEAGLVSARSIDDKVRRILRAMVESGAYPAAASSDPPSPSSPSPHVNTTSVERSALARKVAAASTVLLKNLDDALPLSSDHEDHEKYIVVVGDAARRRPVAVGRGSGHVEPPYIVAPLDGLLTSPVGPRISAYFPSSTVTAASKATQSFISSASVVLLMLATSSTEGADRPTLALPEEDLVSAVTALNSRVVVCVVAPGPVLLPFADDPRIAAIVLQFLPGQEAGAALADVLTGRVNPSARLPVSLPFRDNETNLTAKQYPGVNLEAVYSEGTRIGYRWYAVHGARPRFPFGFGLGYGLVAPHSSDGRGSLASVHSFRVVASGWELQVGVRLCPMRHRSNTRDDTQVVQVYARSASTGEEFLVAVHRVALPPCSSIRSVTHALVHVPLEAIRVYSGESDSWQVPRDLRLRVGLHALDSRALSLDGFASPSERGEAAVVI